MLFSNLLSATTVGVLKRGIARCLLVMVAMGWGVIRDTLGGTLFKIVFLGLLYCGLSLPRDIFAVIANHDIQSISTTQEGELIDLVLVLTPIIIFINLVFFFWIMISFKATSMYLKNMNQTTKLRRHMHLRCLIITSLFIAFIWLLVTIADLVADFLTQEQVWILEASMHANYVLILVGVAILWRPNSNAKDYALQMELPAMGEDGENELELSCVVPSAGDDDGNDPDHPNGLRVDQGKFS